MRSHHTPPCKPKWLAHALAGLLLVPSTAALAETELEALKRELAEQRALIQKLMQAQDAQKEAVTKVEAQAQKAAAQSSGPGSHSLTFYGTADVNVSRTNSGFGNKTGVGSGGMTASSFGLKGQRNLGGDLNAVGEIEAGVSYSTGTAGNGSVTLGVNNTSPSSGGLTGTGPQLFSRQAYAGLSSGSLGTLTIGRQYAGSYIVAATLSNSMGAGFLGNSATFLPVVGGMPTRLNNSVVYRTPSINGFSGWFTYTTGAQNNVSNNLVSGATTTNERAGQGWDAAFFYRSPTLVAALSTWSIANASFATTGETELAQKKGVQAVVTYNLGFARLHGTYVSGTIGGGNYENVTKTLSKANGRGISASIPYAKHTALLSFSRLQDQSLLNKSANLTGLAYTYELYEKTKLYLSWARLSNNANATYSLADGGDLVGNVTTAGFSPSGVVGGVNIQF